MSRGIETRSCVSRSGLAMDKSKPWHRSAARVPAMAIDPELPFSGFCTANGTDYEYM